MPQSNFKSSEKQRLALLDFLVQHESEVRRLFGSTELFQQASDPFSIRIEKNVTLTNQVDEKIYDEFKDFCKGKKIKVKVALMRAMIDLMQNYKDIVPK